ncbi:MAG TPA: fatty acid desaturase [Phenylobacterium sp.]|nr:fatty acid desaturase [Phenylobacterium sp.]
MRAAAQSGTRKDGRIFRYSAWDAVPALLVYAHLAALVGFFIAWPQLSWPARILGAAAYAFAIGWNQDSVSHNFIHNPFFVSPLLNRITEFALTLENGVPQTMYRYVHMRHHAGNSDRPDGRGRTRDPISIYRHGAGGEAEPMAAYVLMGFWRDDDPFTVARAIRAKRPAEARRALQEFWVMVALYAALLAIRWEFVVVLAPFYYLGQSLSFLIAYYEHLGAHPERPLATGVSTYEPVYNLLFLNNGYHAEHHYRPKQHWTEMAKLRREVAVEAAAAGVRVIGPAHFLGFLDPSSWRVPTARRRGETVLT